MIDFFKISPEYNDNYTLIILNNQDLLWSLSRYLNHRGLERKLEYDESYMGQYRSKKLGIVNGAYKPEFRSSILLKITPK